MTREETRGGGTIYSRLDILNKEREHYGLEPIKNALDVLKEAEKLYSYIIRG
tara:strand:+ start:5470 stop:5625 length:156 start_codon:yes stop_codon:yes gene_type:complete